MDVTVVMAIWAMCTNSWKCCVHVHVCYTGIFSYRVFPTGVLSVEKCKNRTGGGVIVL